MSMSISELLDAIAKDDFIASSEQLSLALQKTEIIQIASVLQDIVENENFPSLKIRDHIFEFLGLNPVYLALEIPSYELLQVINSKSRDEVRLELYQLVKKWLESNDSCFIQEGVEVGQLGNSMYASLLPIILAARLSGILQK